MANTLAPRGLINPTLKGGGEPRMHTIAVSSTYAVTFFPGQLLQRAANGFGIHLSTTAYHSVLGVCQSFLAAPSGANHVQNEVQVVTDLINTEWELQLSTANSAGRTLVGNNVNIFSDAYLTKSDTNRRFAPYMVGGTPTTGRLPLRVIGFVVDQKNEMDSANPRVKVEWNLGWLERAATDTPAPGV